ncbi:MAG: hypothetical protein JWR60_705 [Polaromonas sp.]|nr:hypothetical protein [Polaromonas sp.]
MVNQSLRSPRRATAAGLLLLGVLIAGGAQAAKSAGCEGGGFTVLGRTGQQGTTVPAPQIGSTFLVSGRYVQFEVNAATLGVLNYTLTGAPNPEDITGGMRTPVFASKLPDLRGLTLTGPLFLEIDEQELVLTREGPGVTMKVQAKDCAQGGLFQMEVERADETATVFTHTLAGSGGSLTAFYFDNPNFRNREGDVLPYKDTTVTVTPRINFANDTSRRFVGRDSPQVAERIDNPACTNVFPRRPGLTPTTRTVRHCGGVSKWSVASSGRMGMVFGEDAVEVAPPATVCTHQCQAQNRVRGRAVVLGFPFPVPQTDRLKPRFAAIP